MYAQTNKRVLETQQSTFQKVVDENKPKKKAKNLEAMKQDSYNRMWKLGKYKK